MNGHAEIAGAGLTGLALAVMLGRNGWTVRIHESEVSLRPSGGGLYIQQEGMAALRAMGLYDRFASKAWIPTFFETRTDGEAGLFQANESLFATMRRQDLHDILADAAVKAGVEVRTCSHVLAVRDDGTIILADSSTAVADLVVVADGARSVLSQSLGIELERRRYTDGLVRALVNRQSLMGTEWDGSIDFWSYGQRPLRVLYSPCSATECYLALMAPVEDTRALTLPLDVALWSGSFPQLAPLIRKVDGHARFDRYGMIRLKTWSCGRVAIIGDAAHAMPSSRGQGANVGISNAVSLATYLARAQTVRAALAQWEAERRPWIEAIQSEAETLMLARTLSKARPKQEPIFVPGLA